MDINRTALQSLKKWFNLNHLDENKQRKPLVLRGARQVGKSYLVRDFCRREGLTCFELNFEKEPSLKKLFVEGENSKTIQLLEVYFQKKMDSRSILFLDEIQSAPEVFSRLRYFYEDTPEVPIIAAGSLLEFALTEMEYSVPVGRIEYLRLGPIRFEEYLVAAGEHRLVELLQNWKVSSPKTHLPQILHERLLSHVRDFSLVGGMPESVSRFLPKRDFLECQVVHRSILETCQQDFSKFRKKIPQERLEKIFSSIASQVGRKWVYSRINPHEKAHSLEIALDALCKARVAHRVFHSSGNGVPLSAEQKDNLYKVLFIDVGLMGAQLGLSLMDLIDSNAFIRVNEGSIAEQWVGQHLLDLRHLSQSPQLFYWVREKTGSLAEVDYLWSHGAQVFPIEVKAGLSVRAKSLQVFLSEKKKSFLGIHFSLDPGHYNSTRQILQLPFYLIEQLPRLVDEIRNQ